MLLFSWKMGKQASKHGKLVEIHETSRAERLVMCLLCVCVHASKGVVDIVVHCRGTKSEGIRFPFDG